MRYNTLQLVTQVLSALDLDTVSTLGETEESEQVLTILQRGAALLDLDTNWIPKQAVVALSTSPGTTYDTSTDNWYDEYPNIPWAMPVPTGVEAIYEVWYNDKKVTYIEPREFFGRVQRGSAFKTTGDPTTYTIGLMDQDYVVFDNFDSSTESYLVSSKSRVRALKYDTTSPSADTSSIDLSDRFYESLLNFCIMTGAYEILGDIQMGDRYKSLYLSAKNRLHRNQKMQQVIPVELGSVDFSRKRANTIHIDTDLVNDVS